MQLVLFENYQNLDPFLSNYFDYKFKKIKYPSYQRFFLSSRPLGDCTGKVHSSFVGHFWDCLSPVRLLYPIWNLRQVWRLEGINCYSSFSLAEPFLDNTIIRKCSKDNSKNCLEIMEGKFFTAKTAKLSVFSERIVTSFWGPCCLLLLPIQRASNMYSNKDP